MAVLIVVCIIAVVGALIWGVVAWWQPILTILGALFAASLGGFFCAGVCACSRALAHRDSNDFDAKDYFCCACTAIATLLVEIKFGFSDWTWPLTVVVGSLAIVMSFKKKTWGILVDVFIILFKDCLWDTLVWSGHKIIQFARWTRLVIRHGGIGKYNKTQREEQERTRREVARREKAILDKLEEERKRQVAEREKRERAERERVAAAEAVRKDKESRALSELDQIKLKKLAKKRLTSINEKMETYNRTERAEIVHFDFSAFNDYDVPYAQIDFGFRAFGIHIPVSVAFSLARVVKVVIGGTEAQATEWCDVEDKLDRCLELAQVESEVFHDIDDEARRKRYTTEDAVLARRESLTTEKPTVAAFQKLDAFEDLKLRALAFRRMQEMNEILEKFKAPVRADFSSVWIDSSYGNRRGLPCAAIVFKLTLFDKPVQVLIVFDSNKIIECKVGIDVKTVDSWEKSCEALYPYLEAMTDEWQKVAEEKALERSQKKLQQIMEKKKQLLDEQMKAEASRVAEKDRAEKESKALDDVAELELRSVAHKRRQEINHILETFERGERIDEEVVVVDPKAFNVFEQPYARFCFRLKLIGKLYDYEICLNNDAVLRFSVNSNVVSIGGWSDVVNEISRMLVLSRDAGVDDANDDSEHTGLCRIGFLHNFDTHLRELANLAGVDKVDVSALDIRIKKQQNDDKVFCDGDLRTCSRDRAAYQIYDTGLKAKNTSRPIFAMFWRGYVGWFGVRFITQRIRPASHRADEKLRIWMGFDDVGEHRQEQDDSAAIIQQIKLAIDDGTVDWCHVLYNFRIKVPRTFVKYNQIKYRQIDLAIVIKNCILLLELKHYNNPVRGTERSNWRTIDSATGEEIVVHAGHVNVINPFQQVKITRECLGAVLADSKILDERSCRKVISAAVVFGDDLRNGDTDNITVDTSLKYKWFYLGRVSGTIEILRRVIPGENGIETSDKAVKIIKDLFGLQEADLAQGVPVPKYRS